MITFNRPLFGRHLSVAQNQSFETAANPQPAEITSALQADRFEPRFGLKASQLKQKPEIYTVDFTPADAHYDREGKLIPTSAFAERIAQKLARNGNYEKIPAFALIPNLCDFIQASDNDDMYQQVESFQQALFPLVSKAFLSLSPGLKNYGDDFRTMHFPRPDPSPEEENDTNTGGALRPGAGATLKSFHHDAHAILGAHAYGPVRGITGGDFLIFDDQHFAADHGVAVTDLYATNPEDQFYCTPHLKPEWQEKVKHSDYVFPISTQVGQTKSGLDRIPIVFLNNLEVGHGATPITDRAPGAVRQFYRSNLRIYGHQGREYLPFLPFHNPDYHA